MIKPYGQMQNTLKSYDMKNWSKSVELGNKVDFKDKSFGEVNKPDAKTFGDFLLDSVGKVNDLQVQANQAMEQVASGKSQNLHETLLAVEKADIAFRTMNQVRSKVIDAYKEIMKMQV
jgi:flagellar hook-basal body complex protein FliE